MKVLIQDRELPRKNCKVWKHKFMNAHDKEHRMTALHHIVRTCLNEVCNKPDQPDFDLDDWIEMAEVLIENGADVTKADASGYSPLHLVVPSSD